MTKRIGLWGHVGAVAGVRAANRVQATRLTKATRLHRPSFRCRMFALPVSVAVRTLP
jgi:hypothetical protein